MRAHLATVLAFGLVLSFAIVSPPAAAGCSSITTTTTACVTAMYNSAKANAVAKVVGVQAWGSFAPAYVAACPSVPTVGVDVPSLPGPAFLQVYASNLEDAAERFQAGASSDVVDSAALFVGDVMFGTVDVVIVVGESDQLVLGALPAVPEEFEFPLTFPESWTPEQGPLALLPTVNESALPGSPDLPEAPDSPGDAVTSLQQYADENLASLQDGATDTATCVQTMPRPA